MAGVAAKLGINRETLRNWVRQAEVDAGRRRWAVVRAAAQGDPPPCPASGPVASRVHSNYQCRLLLLGVAWLIGAMSSPT